MDKTTHITDCHNRLTGRMPRGVYGVVRSCLTMCLTVFMMAALGLSMTAAVSAPAHADTLSLDDSGHKNTVEQNVEDTWIDGMKRMSRQLSANVMQQAFAIGTFIDARQQIRTQRDINRLTAQAHKRYSPSPQMCVFGSNVKGLADAESSGDVNAMILNEIMMRRESLFQSVDNLEETDEDSKVETASSQGMLSDYALRFEKFRKTYCNPDDHGGEIEDLCNSEENETLQKRANKDISFTHTVDLPQTLDIDFTDDTMTDDEDDVLALGRNLFASRLFNPVQLSLLEQEQAMNDFIDMRSVQAVRSVARNSYTEIVGMKSASDTTTVEFMKSILQSLGGDQLEEDDLERFMTENPSYFAQMDILTSKLYQNPQFYINLYDKPENVKRASVALKAFELMQNRDRYESATRREMMIALLLEMRLREAQEELNNEIFGAMASYVGTPLR